MGQLLFQKHKRLIAKIYIKCIKIPDLNVAILPYFEGSLVILYTGACKFINPLELSILLYKYDIKYHQISTLLT